MNYEAAKAELEAITSERMELRKARWKVWGWCFGPLVGVYALVVAVGERLHDVIPPGSDLAVGFTLLMGVWLIVALVVALLYSMSTTRQLNAICDRSDVKAVEQWLRYYNSHNQSGEPNMDNLVERAISTLSWTIFLAVIVLPLMLMLALAHPLIGLFAVLAALGWAFSQNQGAAALLSVAVWVAVAVGVANYANHKQEVYAQAYYREVKAEKQRLSEVYAAANTPGELARMYTPLCIAELVCIGKDLAIAPTFCKSEAADTIWRNKLTTEDGVEEIEKGLAQAKTGVYSCHPRNREYTTPVPTIQELEDRAAKVAKLEQLAVEKPYPYAQFDEFKPAKAKPAKATKSKAKPAMYLPQTYKVTP